MTATTLYRKRVCVLYDFDLTLAPDSFSVSGVRAHETAGAG